MKLKDKLDRIRAALPKGPTRHGQLYAVATDTKRRYKQVTLYTLFISEENTHLLRPHIFKKEDAMTPAQWHDWFSDKLEEIHKTAVLPGIAIRTNKSWAVERILGWSGNAKHESDTPATRSKGNQTKRPRRKNG